MRKEEIAVGNIVSWNDKEYIISEIVVSMYSKKDYLVTFEGINELVSIEELKPVIFNDTYLDTIGFRRIGPTMYKKRRVLYFSDSNRFYLDDAKIIIENVHQLQNLSNI